MASRIRGALAHQSRDSCLSRSWVTLGVASLVLSGCFAVFIVIARVPGVDSYIADPTFFRRCLVIHVTLALLIWCYAMCAALASLARQGAARVERLSFRVSLIGVCVVLTGLLLTGAEPVLSNYIPAIDHPLFLIGLTLFFAGLLPALRPTGALQRTEAGWLADAALPGVRAAGFAFWVAWIVFVVGALRLPPGLPTAVRYELLFWGPGHVLQFVSVAAMLAVWLSLLKGALGNEVLTPAAATGLFLLLVAPLVVTPLWAAAGPAAAGVHSSYTRLMEIGIFPVVLIVLAAACRGVISACRERGAATLLRDYRVTAFLASAGLTVLGFILGASINGSTTLVPAHYHASIGAVTLSFMALCYATRRELAVEREIWGSSWIPLWQPVLFGVGQAVFALGFGVAGMGGMGRKVYGVEQQAHSFAHSVGLSVMGIGGLLAVVSGILFLVYMVRLLLPAEAPVYPLGEPYATGQ